MHPPRSSARLPLALRTNRLLLRTWRPADAPLLKAALDGSLAHLQASVAWARNEPSPLEVIAARCARSAEGFNAGGDWVYAIMDAADTRVLGGYGCERAEPALAALVGGEAAEVGYWLCADATGHGYASEATAALVGAIAEHLRVPRVVICHDPANTASGGIPRRLGFRCLGTVSDAELPGRQAADGTTRRATTVWVLDMGGRPPA